jgi:hypothetical protein
VNTSDRPDHVGVAKTVRTDGRPLTIVGHASVFTVPRNHSDGMSVATPNHRSGKAAQHVSVPQKNLYFNGGRFGSFINRRPGRLASCCSALGVISTGDIFDHALPIIDVKNEVFKSARGTEPTEADGDCGRPHGRGRDRPNQEGL